MWSGIPCNETEEGILNCLIDDDFCLKTKDCVYDFLMKSPSFQVASNMIVARFSLKEEAYE